MMRRLQTLLVRIGGLFAGRQSDVDLDEELKAHLDMHTAENIRRGMTRPEAKRSALIASGGLTVAAESVRQQRGLPWIETVIADLRYAWRSLRHNAGFATVSVITLALGIGANTAIFSVINAVVLRPLPYPAPDRLVSVASIVNGANAAVSPLDFMDWRREARSFAGLAASTSSETVLSANGNAERVSQARITANAFDVLSVRPLLGRAFLPGEDAVSAPRVAILSEGLWRRRFGADSSIIGRALTFDGFPTVVVGIAPATLRWPDAVDVWMTTRFSERDLSPSSRGARWITVVGRLAPNRTLESARTEMNGIAQQLERADPVHNTNVGTRLTPLLEDMVGDVRKPLFVLFGAVGFVLLIACANVGSLTLGRVAARDAELAVRTTLGASRGRIVRQVLTESLLIAALGGALGLVFAVVGIRTLIALAPGDLPRLEAIGLDAPVLAFTFAATLLTGLLFGGIPAVHGTGTDLHDRLRAAGRGALGRRASARSRRLLVVTEVALSIVLLAGAGLLLRSFAQLRDVDPGFRAEGVATFSLGQLPRKYATREQEIEFTTRLIEGIRRLPGVTAADVSFNLPLNGNGPQLTFTVDGRAAPDPRNEPRGQARAAGPQYFAAMGIPLIRGRWFDARDREGPTSSQVLIISAELARRYFPNEDPIGKYIRTGWSGPGWPGTKFGGVVIGVVGDVRQRALDQGKTPHMYMPYRQWPINEYDVVIRSTVAPSIVLGAARSLLKELDPGVPMNAARALSDIVDASLGQRRFYVMLLAAFAGIALALATVGVYGVIAYGVQQRRREIGIRLALGATRQRVLRMVLTDGLRVIGAGVVLGVFAALAMTRLLSALLYEVGPRDPLTFVVAPATLLIAAIVACVIPAQAAAGLNPVETIRAD